MNPEYTYHNNPESCGASCHCGPASHPQLDRRAFLRVAGIGSLSSSLLWQAAQMPVMAGPFARKDFQSQVPIDKKLSPEWVKSLFARGEKTVYRGTELDKIGMPVGGIGAGQLYLGGDGKLWNWDIFNQHHGTGDGNYAHPPNPASPLDQGFALQITKGGKTQEHALDHTGFSDIRFSGQYPIGTVEYQQDGVPVAVTLEAFSPFIPLNTDDSSLPATVLRFTVKNTSKENVEATLAGWMENAVCLDNRSQPGTRRNQILHKNGFTLLNASAEKPGGPVEAPMPDILFEDWNKDTYAGWTVEGTAFGTGPRKRSQIPDYQGDVGGEGDRVVNSHASAPGGNVQEKDAQIGKLTSQPFSIERNFMTVWIGGGSHKGRTCLNLVVDGKIARSLTGADNNRMSLQSVDVRALKGKKAHIEIVDAETGAWGNIGVGKIVFSDRAATNGPLDTLFDYGTMGLALLGPPADHALAKSEKAGFGAKNGDDASVSLADHLIGALGRKLSLHPGQSSQVMFVVAWHFPNLVIDGLGKVGRHYAARFDSTLAVAQYVANNVTSLTAQTELWRDTWYDSTLPHWFLDRTFLNASTLATSACYRLANGRFYAWEGVGCCPGTCTHVWHYAQAPSRLFPELERDTRERVDLGIAFHPDSGVMGFRAEYDRSMAVDGQTGTILRFYREHQMTPDGAFLKRNWAKIKQTFDPLFALDENKDGVLEGAQMNTLDQPWFGKVSWLSSLYVAALRAGEAMGREMGEGEFADRCRTIADQGAKNIDAELFNGEYYIQRPDPTKPKTVGSYNGCEIDQVFGDSWAHQVGLAPVLPQEHVKTALASLYKYNFTPDVGPFRATHKPGRIYALAGEGGLIMCTWPEGEGARVQTGFDFYLNECMSGFEHQAASHMIWADLVLEGLAVTRAIHDRYHASKRNPWNEVECGDHYSRAMASYGVFLAACGYEYHGPKGHLAFAPRLSPENFKAPFTAAEGWGTWAQKLEGGKVQAHVDVKWGQIRLKTLALTVPKGVQAKTAQVKLNGKAVKISSQTEGNRLILTFAADTLVKAGQKLEVRTA